MVDRMMRAVRADVSLYEEVERNPSYTQEAYTIVGIIAAINVVVALIGGILAGSVGAAVVLALLAGLQIIVGYLIFSYLSYFIGTRVFNGTADAGELQRTLGYAYTPQILVAALQIIPVLGACLAIVPGIWTIYLGYVAVRQALDIDSQKALITVIIAYVVQFIVFTVIFSILGAGALGAGAIMGGNGQ